MNLVMGIDGGGTRTVAVVVDEALHVLGRGQAGPANYHNVGLAAVREALRIAGERACQEAGVRVADLSALGCGLAGAGRKADRVALEQAVRDELPVSILVLTHDAEIALVGGVGRREGVVVIAGTGSIAYGVNAAGACARSGGWGPVLDDRGSGYWIGHQALRRAVCGHERRGAPTALSDAVLEALGLSQMEDLIRWADTRGGVQEIAALTPWVGRCAEGGDHVARRLLRQAGRDLAALVRSVLTGLEMVEVDSRVAMIGGTLRHQPLVVEALAGGLARSAPRAHLMWPLREPAVGAAQLAMVELQAHG